MTNEDFSLLEISAGSEGCIWLFQRWVGVRFSRQHEICCIDDLWSALCEWMIDDECLTRLERAQPIMFWGRPDAEFVMRGAGRRGSLEEWVNDKGIALRCWNGALGWWLCIIAWIQGWGKKGICQSFRAGMICEGVRRQAHCSLRHPAQARCPCCSGHGCTVRALECISLPVSMSLHLSSVGSVRSRAGCVVCMNCDSGKRARRMFRTCGSHSGPVALHSDGSSVFHVVVSWRSELLAWG